MPPHGAPDWQCLERAEQILRASGANICHAAQSGAFYRPATDRIYLPDRGQFRVRPITMRLHCMNWATGPATRPG